MIDVLIGLYAGVGLSIGVWAWAMHDGEPRGFEWALVAWCALLWPLFLAYVATLMWAQSR